MEYDSIWSWYNFDHHGPCCIRIRRSIKGYHVLCWYLNTMLLVVVVVLANLSCVVAATFVVVVGVCALHGIVLLLHVHTLAPDLVISIWLVDTVVFVVEMDFVDIVAETNFVSNSLVTMLDVCLDHLRYPMVAGGRLLGQVKNILPQVVVESTLICLMELGLVVGELEFSVVVQPPFGVLGMLCALQV